MAHVPMFENDVFVSYAHLDDQAVAGDGWVSGFHRRLQIELDEVLGERAIVWRDARLGPAVDFSRDLDRKVRASAVLLAVVSPSYLNSLWCEWELRGFVEGHRRQGDLWVDLNCRAFKVVKRPTDVRHHCDILPETTSTEFFETDRASGRSYELDPQSEPYRRLVSDLAQGIAGVLKAMRRDRTVYLGAAPTSLAVQRQRVRQELEAQEYRVLAAPTAGADDVSAVVRRAVKESALVIHFVDRHPDAASDAASAVGRTERETATHAGARQVLVVRESGDGGAPVWEEMPVAPPGSEVEVLLGPATHALKKTVLDKLKAPSPPPPTQALVRLYLVCDRQDHPLLTSNRARVLRDHLLRLGVEVKVPLAEGGDVAEFTRDNRTKLKHCDGVLLYWGGSRQSWFEERLLELTQAIGWRKGRGFKASAAYVADPPNPVKENYETREVDELIKQFQALDVGDARLARFIARLCQQA